MRPRNATAAAAVAVLLAACGGSDDADSGAAPEETPTETETEGTEGEGAGGEDGDPDTLGDLELPDPAEFISDGEFRGQGVVLPIPDGWSVDEMALMQGLVAASADEDETQQLVAQAIDTTLLGDDQQVSFDDLLEVQRTQFEAVDPELEATIDEAVEIDGASTAHRLRFEDVQIEEQPAFDLELVLAEDDSGRIALFNYAAPADAFDEEIAETMVEGIGIDPDSAPPAPPPVPQEGAGESGDEPMPVEPDEGIGDGAGPPEDEAGTETDPEGGADG